MGELYIRIKNMGPDGEFVEIENWEGESVDIVSNAFEDRDYTLIELDVTRNEKIRTIIERMRKTSWDDRSEEVIEENHKWANELEEAIQE